MEADINNGRTKGEYITAVVLRKVINHPWADASTLSAGKPDL
jgi:hypothetical protein